MDVTIRFNNGLMTLDTNEIESVSIVNAYRSGKKIVIPSVGIFKFLYLKLAGKKIPWKVVDGSSIWKQGRVEVVMKSGDRHIVPVPSSRSAQIIYDGLKRSIFYEGIAYITKNEKIDQTK